MNSSKVHYLPVVKTEEQIVLDAFEQAIQKFGVVNFCLSLVENEIKLFKNAA